MAVALRIAQRLDFRICATPASNRSFGNVHGLDRCLHVLFHLFEDSLHASLAAELSANGRQQTSQMSNFFSSISFWRHSAAFPQRSQQIMHFLRITSSMNVTRFGY